MAAPPSITVSMNDAYTATYPMPDARTDPVGFGDYVLQYCAQLPNVSDPVKPSKTMINLCGIGSPADAVNLAFRPTTTNLNLKRACNLEATLVTMRGILQQKPCTKCVRNCGPFTMCRTYDGMGGGACNNCHYSSGSSGCSLRPDYQGPGGDNSSRRNQRPQKRPNKVTKPAAQAPAPGPKEYTVRELIEQAGFSESGKKKAVRFLGLVYKQAKLMVQEPEEDDDD